MPNGTSSGDWTPVPILMFHNVIASAPPSLSKHVYVAADEFRQHMLALKGRGYQPITFKQLVDAMASREKLPAKPVLLTFDDGYDGLFEQAHPVLAELQFPYTVFLVSSLVGQSNAWDQAIGYPRLDLLSWERIGRMRDSGLAYFEAHTATHARLDKLGEEDCRREVKECVDTMEQKLGARPTVFCYPYGGLDDRVAQIVSEHGFQCAVTTEFGRVRSGDNLLRLPRISIYHVPPASLTYGIRSMNFWWRVESNKDKRPPA